MRQLITAIIIALVTVVFALQNANPVTIKFFVWSVPDTSLSLVLIITLATGLIAGLLFAVPGNYRKNKTISELKRRVSDLENNKPVPKAPSLPPGNIPPF